LFFFKVQTETEEKKVREKEEKKKNREAKKKKSEKQCQHLLCAYIRK